MSPDLTRRVSGHDRIYDAAAVLALLVTSLVMLMTWNDYGITWDERYHLEYGDHILAFFTSGFEDKSALSYRIDYLYGGSFDLLGAIFRVFAEPIKGRDAIHLFGTLVGIAGFWGTWKLARTLGGPRAGLLGAVFIAATSVYWGHVPNNPKDLPFAVGYVWAMAYLVEAIRAFPQVPRSLAIKLAIAIGMAMSVRIAGMLLLCYLAAAIAIWVAYHAWLRRDAEAIYRYGRRLATTGLGVAAGAWLLMIVWWPWALYDPIKRPLAALRRMSAYMGHERKMPFAGEMISTFDVDWRYLPHYFGLNLPEFVVVLGVIGGVFGLGLLVGRARDVRYFTDNLVLGTVLLALLFPWAYAVYKHSVLYDGLRHFLFEVPLIIAGVAWFTDAILGRILARFGRPGGVLAAAVLTGLCVDQYATMARLHPHEYVYFNRFIGGLAGAVGNYDTDYYAETYVEGGKEFARELWLREPDRFLDTIYVIGGCGGDYRPVHRAPPNFKADKDRPDFWMAYTRDDCHLRHEESPVIFELTREGGLLLLVRDLRDSPTEDQ
jgi:hypothetical protein